MIKQNISTVLGEINNVLSQIDENQVKVLAAKIINGNTIVTVGAGRVGMATRAFAMRLKHLGLDAYNINDCNVPSIKQGDLLLAASGSGETQTIYDLVAIAKKNGAGVALITGNRESRMGQMADAIVEIKAPSKTKPIENFKSIQPMTTLNEQCLGLFFDILVLELMEKMNETHETMWARHSNLE